MRYYSDALLQLRLILLARDFSNPWVLVVEEQLHERTHSFALHVATVDRYEAGNLRVCQVQLASLYVANQQLKPSPTVVSILTQLAQKCRYNVLPLVVAASAYSRK